MSRGKTDNGNSLVSKIRVLIIRGKENIPLSWLEERKVHFLSEIKKVRNYTSVSGIKRYNNYIFVSRQKKSRKIIFSCWDWWRIKVVFSSQDLRKIENQIKVWTYWKIYVSDGTEIKISFNHVFWFYGFGKKWIYWQTFQEEWRSKSETLIIFNTRKKPTFLL